MKNSLRESLLRQGVIPEVVIAASEQVKAEYIRARRAIAPDYSPRKENDEFFDKAAVQLIRLGSTPPEWISAMFSVEYIPNPSQLQGDAAERVYSEYLNKADDRIKAVSVHVTTYANLFDRLSSKPGDIQDHVRVSADSFGPVFLWCLAVSLNMPDIRSKVERLAAKMLRRHPYLSVYQKAFPYLTKQLEEVSS